MTISVDVVVFGSSCGAGDNCRLLRTASDATGGRRIFRWEVWNPDQRDAANKTTVFLVLAAGDCGSDGKDVRRWWLEFLKRTGPLPQVRLGPVVLLSPHVPKVIRDLREATGFDLDREPGMLAGRLPHELAGAGPLCEHAAVQTEVVRLLGKVALAGFPLDEARAQNLVADANLRQAVSVLEIAARQLHGDLHSLRSQMAEGLPPGKETGLGPADRIEGLESRLSLVLVPRHVEEFVKTGTRYIKSLPAREEQVAAAAAYLEESAACIRWQQRTARVGQDPRRVIVIVDDDKNAANALQLQMNEGGDLDARVVIFPDDEVEAVLRQTRLCGGDPSKAVADAVWNAVAGTLSKLLARSKWRCDHTQFVLVTDVRLALDAPDAGLWLIRRARDCFPFLKTVALTVRRGLADELFDEAVDAYIIKKGDSNEIGSRVLDTVRTLTEGGAYILLPGTENLARDPMFSLLVSRKHLLMPASAEAIGARLAVALAKDAVDAANAITDDGVVAIVVPADDQENTAFRLASTLKKQYQGRLVLLRMTGAPGTAAQLLPSSIVALDRMMHTGRVVQHDVRWSLLVPKVANWAGIPVVAHDRDLSYLRAEVSARFGGATGIEARGIWIRPTDNVVVRDDMEAIQVWARGTESGHQYMLDLAGDVVRMFGQDEVILVEEGIRTWSVSSSEFLPTGIPFDRSGRLDVAFAFTARSNASRGENP
ncbi:MAG: hypothetical protein A3G20_10085 [Acidobacteria bacterium RIFCSPLOWO2_12_FULL_59_11]|nr:MAG: hypothetical protein A3G20_10085 [Acidobacteria bacterium RIFCSPLOWO2_12_FULL_59_11]